MTPEAELKNLNKLIKQYETVYRTANDGDQRERVAKELKQLKSYRDKILAVNVFEDISLEEPVLDDDELEEYPILKRLVLQREEEEQEQERMQTLVPAEDRDEPTASEKEVSRVGLYMDFFEKEYIPFLTEMRLKLDFKFSMERDGFYRRFQELMRKIVDYRDEVKRLAEGTFTKEMETEIKKRTFKLKRILEAEASRFFRAIKRFTTELAEDARTDGVKCLNGEDLISFDRIEGKRYLAGQRVTNALVELGTYADEVILFLNVPDLESQENERADRY
jgi:hypothetical protein